MFMYAHICLIDINPLLPYLNLHGICTCIWCIYIYTHYIHISIYIHTIYTIYICPEAQEFVATEVFQGSADETSPANKAELALGLPKGPRTQIIRVPLEGL